MVYDPKTWVTGELITAEDLNRLEQAVDATDAALDAKVDDTDSRLTDARTPTAHQHAVADVTGLADRLTALERSTGWRLVSLASGTGGQLFLKREGSRVSVVVSGFRPAATGVNLLAELPVGFRPRFTAPHVWADEQGAPRAVYALAYSPFRLEVRAISLVGSYVYASGRWDTGEPWPTTLPGTPA